jgi:hypothetical protein
MIWVMVPVPEELAPAVASLVFHLSFTASRQQWDHALMGDHLLSLADEPRAALFAVAAGVLAGDPIEDVQLAEQLEVSVREVFGVVRDANDVTVASLAGELIASRLEQVDDGAGGERVRRLLYMLPSLAEMVRDQEHSLGLRRPTSPAG